jgi:hypothetical protein
MLEMVLEMTRRIDADRLPERASTADSGTTREGSGSNIAA